MRKLNYFILISSIGLVSTAQAEVGFNKSDDVTGQTVTVNIGPSQFTSTTHPAPIGSPGMGISTIHNGTRIGFQGMISSPRYTMPQDTHGFYDSSLLARRGHTGTNNGDYRFAKVEDQEVYFGDWKYSEDDTQYRNVYYAGENITTDMPTTGSATYSTTAIDGYHAINGPLTGDLVANFATNKLEGDLANTSRTLNIDANIHSATATFDGLAKITTSDNREINGSTEGHFFNEQASSLAGTTKFDDAPIFNSSFAGKKQD